MGDWGIEEILYGYFGGDENGNRQSHVKERRELSKLLEEDAELSE